MSLRCGIFRFLSSVCVFVFSVSGAMADICHSATITLNHNPRGDVPETSYSIWTDRLYVGQTAGFRWPTYILNQNQPWKTCDTLPEDPSSKKVFVGFVPQGFGMSIRSYGGWEDDYETALYIYSQFLNFYQNYGYNTSVETWTSPFLQFMFTNPAGSIKSDRVLLPFEDHDGFFYTPAISEYYGDYGPRFMGYYEDKDSLDYQYIDAYGNLTMLGNQVAKNYPGFNDIASYVSSGSLYTGNSKYDWYAIWAPESSIRLWAKNADSWSRGKAFLFYDKLSHNLYSDYYPRTGNFGTQLTVDSVVSPMPSREGHTFMGYWSVPQASGGEQYIDANGNITQAGIDAVASYDGSLQKWYARWWEVPHTLKYYCADGNWNTPDTVAYTDPTITSDITLYPGQTRDGDPIICDAPSPDHEFVGWACGTHYFNPMITVGHHAYTFSVYDILFVGQVDQGVALQTSQFNILYDTDCWSIWRKKMSCDAGDPVKFILGQNEQDSTVDLREMFISDPSHDDAALLNSDGSQPVEFRYGTVNLKGLCRDANAGVMGYPGDPYAPVYDPRDTIPSCWCQVTGWTPTGGSYIQLNDMPWVYSGDDCNGAGEDLECTMNCGKSVLGEQVGRESAFTTYRCPGTHVVSYDCGRFGSFKEGAAYNDTNNSMTVIEQETYTIPRMPEVCTSEYEANTTGEHVIASGWRCVANGGREGTYLPYNEDGDNMWGSGDIWDYDYTCTAQWVNNNVSYPFSVKTPNLNAGDTFTFTISARGLFYVDCGTDGSLTSSASSNDVSGNQSVGWTINKTSSTNNNTYTCTYSSGGSKTIQFGGYATGYRSDSVAAIKFTTPAKIQSVSGNLSAIFRYVSATTDTKFPKFIDTFKDSINLTTVPATLFGSLTSIPEPATSMFMSTFYNSGLTSIPAGLFSNIRASGEGMFNVTFAYCANLTTIPSGLFAGITSGADNMFGMTFANSGLRPTSDNSEPIPDNLFANITTGAEWMFASTFADCTGLKSIPANLFSNITTGANKLFYGTFQGCSGFAENPDASLPSARYNFIPSTLFAGLINANNPDQTLQSPDMMWLTFHHSSLRTCCPAGYEQFITGYEGDIDSNRYKGWESYVSCKPCENGLVSEECGSCHEPAPNYTVTYNPGTVGNSASGMPNPNPQTVEQGGSYTLPAAPSASGYEFLMWSCNSSLTEDTDSIQVYAANQSYTFNNNQNVICTAVWHEAVTPCADNETLMVYVLGQPISESTINFEATSNGNNCGSGCVGHYYGNVHVTGMCSTTAGGAYQSGNPENTGNSGRYCWCRVTQFDPVEGESVTFAEGESNWIYLGEGASGDHGRCGCQDYCESAVAIDSFADFRQSLYTTQQCVANYNVTYDCNKPGINAEPVVHSYAVGTQINVTPATEGCGVSSGQNRNDPEFVGWFCSWGNLGPITIGHFSVDGVDNSTISAYPNLVGAGQNVNFDLQHDTLCVGIWREKTSCPTGQVSTTLVLGGPASDFDQSWWDDFSNSEVTQLPGDFVFNNYGTVSLEYMLSSTLGIPFQPGNPSNTAGNGCWCRVREYTPLGENNTTTQPGDLPWVYARTMTVVEEHLCNEDCIKYFNYIHSEDYVIFRHALYTTYQCVADETFTVTYSCGENASGTAPVDNGTYTSGQTATVLPNGEDNCTYEGYTFNGWDCGAVGEGIEITGNVTCTAQWQQNETFTVTYSCGENATGDAPVDGNSPYNYGINATILSNTNADTGEDYCTYDGYTFSGWDCGAVGEFLSMTHDYTCEARWEQNETFTVTYSCGENATGDAPVDNGTYTSGQTATILPNGEDNCTYEGYTFNGWDCGTVGEGIEITGNVTCTAQWQRDYEFWVDTMSLNSGDNFKFKISARGTFYVNCGENGTLSGNGGVIQDSLGGANGYVINRTSNTSNDTYICNYSSGGEKTIAFAGDATGYDSGINVPAITFDTETGYINAQKVNAIRGDLSAVFGYIGSSNSEYPRFIGTFQNCRNLTSIPNTLFASLTNSGEYMFGMTFKNCVGLVSTNANNNQPIPGDLFNFGGNNVSGAEIMFKSTFKGCSGLTSIPENLFSHINGSANNLFSATFMDCTNLTSIPGILFNFGGNNVSGAEYMFYQTFENCAGLTTIPENLFAHISSSAQFMFANAFAGCSSLVSIPENLFAFSGSSVIPGGRYMFQGTFKNCVGLTSIPEGLFVHVMVPSSSPLPVGMFNMTFYGCTGLKYLPKNLFSHITNPAQNLFQETFKNCTGFENYTDSNGEMHWRFIPSTLFNGLIDEDSPFESNMMLNIFNGDTTLYQCCPAGFEKFDVGFWYANWWSPYVSCAACPEGTTAAEILEGSGCYECLEPGEQAGGIRIATSNMSSGDTFDFDLSAAGTFYVDCGVDGRLVSTTDDVTPGEVTGWVIRRNNTDNATYRCSYSSRGEKMVRFSGRATAYNGEVGTGSNGEMTAVPAISFEPARERLVSVDGDLSKMFPILGQSDKKIPRFYRTFANCVSLEKISGKLFRRYTSGTTLMFGSTFAGCRRLKEIPGNLFSNIVKGADQMFVQTFSGCDRLEGFIAPNLFAGLIANHSPYSKDMMRGIFDETSLATRCPEKYSQYITGYERYWDKHVSCEPMQTYNVVYDCGGGLGRAPASKEIRVGEVFIAANNTCTPPRDDMVFAGWEVSGTDDVSREESSTEWGYRESKTLTAKWAPSSGFECKTGKYLHIGEERMCLAEEEEVEKPALAVGVKGKNVVHYLQMTVQDMNSEPLPINDKSSKKLNILYKGDLYNVHDGSVGK